MAIIQGLFSWLLHHNKDNESTLLHSPRFRRSWLQNCIGLTFRQDKCWFTILAGYIFHSYLI